MTTPDADTPLCYHAVVEPDADGLAHGDGRYRAVGYRVNVATGWVSAYPWIGYGTTPERAVQALERVLGERYGSPVEARHIRYGVVGDD